MPELPEVETVRDGVARHVLGRTVHDVEVRRASAVRRHEAGPADLVARLRGRTLHAAVRRGKYLWVLLDDDASGEALVAHLGMSGQLLVRTGDDLPEHPHLRARFRLDGGALDFVDQRTFGHLGLDDLVPTPDGAPGGHGSGVAAVPRAVAHIARDLLDPHLDRPALVARLRSRRTEVKRALLDQTLVSGIGNIYADEALWRAGLHGARPTGALRPVDVRRLLDAAEEVMRAALAAGGTSFDALYVNVNGASGYFDRSLAVYGQAGRPCPRCGSTVVRDAFMNRSSFRCPRCQPRPRTAGLGRTGRGTA
ncbi:bifunctional DNA-formamidopyrimidine glycosylase/DNA-(apurinic or apyrimidinic site) lyase [Cellulomonas carbonis]|uniref:Formamidopyrimidine-DNA glycosylase n=1 Tax=Cellulomonas carbonis T26 TaxID=947969 RepID=A0A0A0BMW7_9CELL|nr:bifunctional DNA-formamidopyrimidine glycosylase/DNA-(apurinic or apyrimidinic site) lyase [Cellulomonas carbonis]KGM09291.1 5-hydroxymethyluracil DNA glycosylase [Cellulomonas carbonis T26]GGC12753.1 formamidopyrimidine-DNA glycosylase [Cellulomonas carbonis]